MKKNLEWVFLSAVLLSCGTATTNHSPAPAPRLILGTWKLLKGTVVEKGDTTITDYTGKTSFIKIINDTHFAFLQHDLSKGKDSATVFASGGGRYSLTDSLYTEHLEYCSAREWEGHDFSFTLEFRGDTLIQRGVEKIESAGVDRFNQEMYIKVKE